MTVAKAERNAQMAHGASLNAGAMGNQQPSPEQGKVQRLSFAGVGPSGPKWFAPHEAGEDIVCAHVKAWGVRLKAGGTALEQRTNVNIRMKQLMAGGGVAMIGMKLIPLLANLFN